MKDTPSRIRRAFDPRQVGWRIGRAVEPRAGELWCPWDRTAGVIGPQGSGKTLDLLIPALVAAPGFDLKPVEPRAGFAQPARPRDPPKWTRKGPHQGSREMARRRGELGHRARRGGA